MDVEIGGPSAREANPKIFDLVDRLVATFENHHDTRLDPEDATHVVQLKIVDRAHNIVKAVVVMCENQWWEFADGLVRQLFEVLLNLEELQRAGDQHAAAKRWLRFGALEQMLRLAAERKYDADRGRLAEGGAEKVTTFRQGLPGLFPDFVRYSKSGEVSLSDEGDVNFVASWHGKSIKELAEAADDPMRLHQYELLFRPASGQVHASPAALMTGLVTEIVAGENGPGVGIRPWLMPEEMATQDAHAIRQTLSMAFAFFSAILVLTDDLHGTGPRVAVLVDEIARHMHEVNGTTA